MAKLKKRVAKLEKLQPSGLQQLSDEELDARILSMCNTTELHDWIENNDSLRIRFKRILTVEHEAI